MKGVYGPLAALSAIAFVFIFSAAMTAPSGDLPSSIHEITKTSTTNAVRYTAAAAVASNPSYDSYMGGAYGAAKDQGETDDPLTDGVSYAGTVYYIDSVAGDDSKDGLSPAKAWKTISQATKKFNAGAGTVAPADSAFLFKRGGTYPGYFGLRSPNKYTFGAYGERSQPRPIIQNNGSSAVYTFSDLQPNMQLVFRNLHFVGNTTISHVGMVLSSTKSSSIINSEIEGFDSDGIYMPGSTDLTIENSVIYNTSRGGGSGGGVTGNGINIKILRSSFVKNGANPIFAHGLYLRYLTNALIEGNLFVGSSNTGFVIHGSSDGVTIRGNEFFANNVGLGITAGYHESEKFNNFLIENNVMHNNTGNGMDLSSITNTTIRNNVVYGNSRAAASFGGAIDTDAPSNNVQVYNNMMSGAVGIGTYATLSTNISFTKNIFFSPESSPSSFVFSKYPELPSAQLTLDTNLYYMPNKTDGKVVQYNYTSLTFNNFVSSTAHEPHGLYADPLFVNAAAGNFTLKSGSPALAAGIGPSATIVPPTPVTPPPTTITPPPQTTTNPQTTQTTQPTQNTVTTSNQTVTQTTQRTPTNAYIPPPTPAPTITQSGGAGLVRASVKSYYDSHRTCYGLSGNDYGDCVTYTYNPQLTWEVVPDPTSTPVISSSNSSIVITPIHAIVPGATTSAVPSTTGVKTSLNIKRTLVQGSRGDDVLSLQTVLIAKGFLKIDGAPTTYFGSLTLAAVKTFQCTYNIVCSGESWGVVGPKTRAQLQAL